MMKMLTAPIKKKLLAQSKVRDSSKNRPVVKFFVPWGAGTWLISEMDSDGDTLFGLCDLGHESPELGYVSLSELMSIRGPFGLKIERDLYFVADGTLSEYAAGSLAA